MEEGYVDCILLVACVFVTAIRGADAMLPPLTLNVVSLYTCLIQLAAPHIRNNVNSLSIHTFVWMFIIIFSLLFISNQIEEIQSIYNPICCLIILSWKGDHPAMSPQSCRSEVQRLFSLLLLIGCVSVSNSGLGWDSDLLRCLLILSLMTSLT